MSEMFKGVSTTKETWWRRWLVRPVVGQLTCGVSPQKIAWTISLGIVLGVFPVMGVFSNGLDAPPQSTGFARI